MPSTTEESEYTVAVSSVEPLILELGPPFSSLLEGSVAMKRAYFVCLLLFLAAPVFGQSNNVPLINQPTGKASPPAGKGNLRALRRARKRLWLGRASR